MRPWLKIIALFAAAALVLLALRIPGWLRSLELTPSAWTTAFWFALLALSITCAAWFAYKRLFPGPHEVAEFAQGFGAVVTVVAIFVAAGIYFLERRDKPRVSPTLSVNAVRLPTPEGRPKQVLLVVRLAIKNEGARQILIRCSSLALLGVKSGQEVLRAIQDPRRGARDSEEMDFGPVADPINYSSGEPCNAAEEKRREWPAGKVMPLYRWGLASHVEPGETDNRYFESPVSCEFELLRVLAKLRINPDDTYGYEVKDLISISKVCAGDREIATGISERVEEGEIANREQADAVSRAHGNAP